MFFSYFQGFYIQHKLKTGKVWVSLAHEWSRTIIYGSPLQYLFESVFSTYMLLKRHIIYIISTGYMCIMFFVWIPFNLIFWEIYTVNIMVSEIFSASRRRRTDRQQRLNNRVPLASYGTLKIRSKVKNPKSFKQYPDQNKHPQTAQTFVPLNKSHHKPPVSQSIHSLRHWGRHISPFYTQITLIQRANSSLSRHHRLLLTLL